MDLPRAFARTTYDRIVKTIKEASSEIANRSMLNALEEEVKMTGDRNSLVVSGDGSWRKRGFQSLQGIVAIIGNKCGKVIDIVVKSTYCNACKMMEKFIGTKKYLDWLDGHFDDCTQNHEGCSGKMEVDGICEIFKRSVQKFFARFKIYVGDGDTKTFAALEDMQPYGKDFPVSKADCIGHVQKRMGTRLRVMKKKTPGIGGQGKLTDTLIKKLSRYYGNAIRSNNTVEDMQNSIWATFENYSSTDKAPQHDKCPAGSDSWCSWQKAKANNELKQYKHNTALPLEVLNAIRPIYVDLSDSKLLAKCLGHYTQNANESFHSLVWKIASKESFSGLDILKIAAKVALAKFNDGSKCFLHILNALGLDTGSRALDMCKAVDQQRLNDAEKSEAEATKEARLSKNLRLAASAKANKDLEDSFYSAGSF